MDADDLIDHLKAEIDRLQVLLRAERAETRRLNAAVAHLKEAAGIARGVLEATDGADLTTEAFGSALSAINGCVADADAQITPVADPD